MSTDPNASFGDAPVPELRSLASGTGSLAQSARLKQLNVARGIMFVVGALTIAFNVFQYSMVGSLVDGEVQKQLDVIARQGRMVDPAKVAEFKAAAVRSVQLVAMGLIGLGVLYIVFGLIVRKYPVPVTIAALVIYVATTVIFGILSPETLVQGIIFKVIIVVALVKAVQAALAYQRALDSAGFSENAGISG
jgi:hypothetical protein